MKYIRLLCWTGVILLLLLLPYESLAQDRIRPYLNAGYVTNFKKCSDCTKADAGGSIRVGILTRGRFGFYSGYVWFNEYHMDYYEYDDKGWLLIAGVDFRVLKIRDFQGYLKGGIGMEKFVSTYLSGTETETSFKPDIGLLFNIKHFNAYVGWQPSEPHHINIGAGFTF